MIIVSCQKQKQDSDLPSMIDREKINASFNKDISKVLLDHLYVVVDSLTYDRFTKNNQWMTKYASLDIGLPNFAPVNNHSSTCYLRGHQHYIEILGPKNKYKEPVGKSGIGFSLKNKGEHFHLGVVPRTKATKDSLLLYATETVHMDLGQHKQTWFKAFYTPSPGTALHTWYAFYNPTFLDTLYKKHHAQYSRKAFLKSSYEKTKLFNGIDEIYLTCIPKDYIRIAKELGFLKCRLLKKNGKTLTFQGGDITIHLKPSENAEYSRITRIICQLNTNDRSITHLGNLTITNQGTESIWDFDQLHKTNL